MNTLKIAIDYDETYTKLPELFNTFIKIALRDNHIVKFVTFRYKKYDNLDIELDAKNLGIPIIYTNGQQKRKYWNADIWIDDSPITIPVLKELQSMVRGCINNKDY